MLRGWGPARRTAPLLPLLLGLALLAAGPALAWQGSPAAWVADVADMYVGREWNAGVMACARTQFSVQDGTLTGHYWIDDAEPFEGDLTGFTPDADADLPSGGQGGLFTWTDRYGEGVLRIVFAADGQSFVSQWGTGPDDLQHPGFGRRGAEASVPGCNSATS